MHCINFDVDDSSRRFFVANEQKAEHSFLSESPMKKVTFASVEVREYPIILGDSPACSKGAPISIDWDADASTSYTIDEWESKRYFARRSKTDIRVPSATRVEWLLDAGYSTGRIYQAIRDTEEERRQLQLSNERSSLALKADMVAERMKIKLELAIGERGRSQNSTKRWTLSPNGFLLPSK